MHPRRVFFITQMKPLEQVQKEATSWILNQKAENYTERLKRLELLSVLMSFEVHDLLHLISLIN